jgi:hypothetical protein
MLQQSHQPTALKLNITDRDHIVSSMDYTFRHLRGRRVAAAALIIILIYNLRQIYARTIKQLGTQSAHVKPQKITVSGLVFYGRKDRASCMHSYLEVSVRIDMIHLLTSSPLCSET